MATADGTVVISFDSDISNAKKKIASLKTSIQNLKTSISEKEFKQGAINEQIHAFEEQVKKQQSLVAELRAEYMAHSDRVLPKEKYDKAVEELSQMQTQYSSLVAESDKLSASIQKDTLDLQAMQQAGAELQQQVAAAGWEEQQAAESAKAAEEARLQAIRNSAGEANSRTVALQEELRSLNEQKKEFETAGVGLGYEEYDNIIVRIKEINAELAEYKANLESAEELLQGSAQAMKDLESFTTWMGGAFTKGINSLVSGIANGISSVAKRITKGVGSAIKGIAKGVASLARKAATSFTGIKKSNGGLLDSIKRIAPALLVARGAMGILRKAVDAYMQQNQQLSSTLSGAWLNLGNILGPIINRIVNLTATAIAYVTKFLNLLGFTGKAAASEMSSAGGAAKKETDELKKQLLSFDELNVLSDQSDSSGGGGGSGAATGITPEVTLPDWAQIMAEQLKSAQWAEAAQTLTTALNNMVDSVDWAGIGAKLGTALNGALTFLATFINTFDWFGLGANLATGVNNLIENVDWANLGTLLAGKFKIIVETLAGFLLNLDMTKLAQAANNIIISFFNSLTETIQSVDWYAIGEQVRLFLVNLDWVGIAESVFTAVGVGFAGLVAFIQGLIGDALTNFKGKYITPYIDEAIEAGGSVVDGIYLGIKAAISDIAAWIKEHIFQPFMDGFKSVFGIHSPSTAMMEQGGYIIDGLLSGITGAWQSVKTWINGALTDMKDAFASAWNYIHDITASIWSGIVGAIKGAVNGVIGVINNMIAAVVSGINALFSALSFNISLPGGKSIGLNLPQFSAPQIPYLAQGAVIPPNAPFAAVLGDQSHGNNIEAPEALIRKIVREETANGIDVTVSFEGNMGQLIRTLTPMITAQQRRENRALGV